MKFDYSHGWSVWQANESYDIPANSKWTKLDNMIFTHTYTFEGYNVETDFCRKVCNSTAPSVMIQVDTVPLCCNIRGILLCTKLCFEKHCTQPSPGRIHMPILEMLGSAC